MGTSGADTSDLHALRAADWNVNSARSNLPFGWCNASTACRDMPAHAEAHNTTGKDEDVFMPPANVRGDLARALMYMAVRYDGSEPHTERLRLGNCPCGSTATMGVLSVLLEWVYHSFVVCLSPALRSLTFVFTFEAHVRLLMRVHTGSTHKTHLLVPK